MSNGIISSSYVAYIEDILTSSSVLPDTSTSVTAAPTSRRGGRATPSNDLASATDTSANTDSVDAATDAASSSIFRSTTLASVTSQFTPQAAAITSASSTATSPVGAIVTPANTQHHGLSSGAIAAVVVVPLLVIGAAVGAFLFVWLRRRRARDRVSFHGDGGSNDYQEKTPGTITQAREHAEPNPADYNTLFGFPVPAATRAFSRVSHRPSMSTIRTTTSTIAPHPPVLPPIETYSFQRSVSTEIIGPPAAVTAPVTPTTLRRGDSASSSNSSSNLDPFATPSPSTAHTREPSMASNRFSSQPDQPPTFTFRRASTPSAPLSIPETASMPFHLQRPAAAAVRTESNNTIDTISSQHASITPSMAADDDHDEEAQVAEAVPVRRAQRQRASIVDLNGDARRARRHGREGSAGSESVESIGEAF